MEMVTEAELIKKISTHKKDCEKMSEVDMMKSQNRLFRWLISVAVGVLISVWVGSIKTAMDFTKVKTQVQMLIDAERARIKSQGTRYKNSNSEEIRVFPGVMILKSEE